MSWPSATEGWVLADNADGTRILLRTADAGASWTPGPTPDVSGARQVIFADSADGWIVGDSGLESTHNGGAEWAVVNIAGGMTGGAAVTAAGGTVHVAYTADSGIKIASSPIDHDAFAPAAVAIPFGAGPRLDVSMSAGGPYGELIYNDRTFVGAAEIRNGKWVTWDVGCPDANPVAAAGLSPQGQAVAIACGPSGFGDNAPVVGADLSSGSTQWRTIEPAGASDQGQAILDFATATDAGVRVVVFISADGSGVIASSTDGGATWPTRIPLPDGASPSAIAHLPDGSLLMATDPSGGLYSADGLTWTPVATTPG